MKKDVISLIAKNTLALDKIPCEHKINELLFLKGNKDDIPSLDELPQKVHFLSFLRKKVGHRIRNAIC